MGLSRAEDILGAMVDGTDSSQLEEPQSRVEDILESMLDGADPSQLPEPQSRVEDLLIQLSDKISHDGGGGGGGGGGGDGGSEGQALSDVNFYDYDGTVVYSYTAEEFAALEQMPPNPDRTADGLTAQGWNWSITDAKTYVANYGMLEIGQMYIPTDGKTHIFIHLDSNKPISFDLRFGQTKSNGVTVDWGDDTTPETFTGYSTTAGTTHSHVYENGGDYEITLDVTDGTAFFIGYKSGGSNENVQSIFGKIVSNGFNRTAVQKVYIGDKITKIGTYVFAYCYNLESVTIPRNVDSDSYNSTYTFCYCRSLKHITLPDGMTKLWERTFSQCESMKHVSIPKSITDFGNNAFSSCKSLKRITFPDSITSNGSSICGYCDELECASVSANVASLMFTSCYKLNKVVMTSGITQIGDSAFNQCYGLESITIPNSVQSIGSSAFYQCHKLRSIDLPEAEEYTTIENMFNECYSLRSITIPSNVTTISGSAFSTCTGISEFHMKPTSPPTIASNSFSIVNSTLPEISIYVPYSSDHSVLAAYKAANEWSTLADYIVEESPS